jgi:hypothetical protein
VPNRDSRCPERDTSEDAGPTLGCAARMNLSCPGRLTVLAASAKVYASAARGPRSRYAQEDIRAQPANMDRALDALDFLLPQPQSCRPSKRPPHFRFDTIIPKV